MEPKKIKILSLLSRIAIDEEIPNAVIYENEKYYYDELEDDYYNIKTGEYLFDILYDHYSPKWFALTEVEIADDEPRPILTDKEKEYLSAVIKPFRNEIGHIRKCNYGSSGKEYISIQIHDERLSLPKFKKGTLYKEMKLDKLYFLEDLGL